MTSLVELRLLEGPNLYFPRAAVKLSLDVAAIEGVPAEEARRMATALGMPRVAPGEPGTTARMSFVLRLLRFTARRLAAAAGLSRLAVRVRPGSAPDQAILAFPWKHAGRATAFGNALVTVLDEVPGCDALALTALLTAGGEQVRDSEPGRAPSAVKPHVPTICVTGTNGKTTTTRLLAHMGMTAGLRTAWSSTDGVVVQGEMVEPGDYSGPSGGRTVLATDGLELAILETARGGMLLKGMGVVSNDVSVVTNVSADHLGLQGIDTVDQLAEVKAIITKVTKPDGWVVLNGDDPRVLAMRSTASGRPFIFSLDPASPSLREALQHGGRAITVMDGYVTLMSAGGDPSPLVRVLDLPITMAGLSEYNVANALAAAAAALSIGLSREVVVAALKSFTTDASLNPGRLNTFTLPIDGGTCTVVMDLAHNEAGLQAMLGVTRGLVAPGASLLLLLGAVGDRASDMLTAMGEVAGKGADQLRIAHKDRYLRGRTHAELEALLRAGAASVGVHNVPVSPTEVEGLADLVADARPGDVVAVMVHEDRQGVYDWLAEHGAVPDGPAQVRAKVALNRGLHPDEDELIAAASLAPPARVAQLKELAERRPRDARLMFELARAQEDAGAPGEVVRKGLAAALAGGLAEPYRREASLSLALSLLGSGAPAEALEILERLREERRGQVAVDAAMALALRGVGRADDALRLAVTSLADFADVESRTERLRELATPDEPGISAEPATSGKLAASDA